MKLENLKNPSVPTMFILACPEGALNNAPKFTQNFGEEKLSCPFSKGSLDLWPPDMWMYMGFCGHFLWTFFPKKYSTLFNFFFFSYIFQIFFFTFFDICKGFFLTFFRFFFFFFLYIVFGNFSDFFLIFFGNFSDFFFFSDLFYIYRTFFRLFFFFF